MRPHRSHHPMLRPNSALAALAVILPILAGCHQAADTNADPSPSTTLRAAADTPTNLPVTPALFASVAALTPPPAGQVEHAPLPPRPSDTGEVARRAVSATPAPVGTAPGNAGLVVCDPVAGSPELSAFGSGCGRWLDLVAAGQPELGRTPFWASRARAQHEMGRKDLRLSPAQAIALASMTGATHAACGTISGTPERCTLTYSLYQLPGGKPVGPALTRTGSEAQILDGLPAMAKALDARLGVPAPRVPTSVVLSPAELMQVETLRQGVQLTDADLSALARLSARSPVAGMLYLESRAVNDQVLLTGMVKTLRDQLPGNALVLAHIGYKEAAALRPYAATTQTLFTRYPASALLAHTDVWQQRVWGTRAGELEATLRTTHDAPGDPDSWLTLGYTLSNISEDLRQSRLAGDISETEWATLQHLYSRMESADLRATALDPHEGHAWLRLAETATFAGDESRATNAIGKAFAMDLDKREVYAWGLQMYQPKWYGDPAALNKIAALAAAEPWDDSSNAISAAESLRSAGFATQSDAVLSGFLARVRAEVAKTPSDALPHWNLAAALAAQNTPAGMQEASLEYRTAEHLMPNAPAIPRWLGDVLDRRHKTVEAIAEYQRAIALDPFDSAAHLALGDDLKRKSQFPEALSELRLAMRLNPHNESAHMGLGELLSMQQQFKQAAVEYREAIRMSYYALDARIALVRALNESGQYDEAVTAGREADRLLTELGEANAETESQVHNIVADACLHKKEWNHSIAESNATLEYNPNDAWAHENLAEAYIGKGEKTLAQAEWTKTIALGNPTLAAVARKLLAAHP